MPAPDDAESVSSATVRAGTAASCPSCGTPRSGRSTYCEECGAELSGVGTPSAAARGLTTLFVVIWTVILVGVLFWLTGQMLLLK